MIHKYDEETRKTIWTKWRCDNGKQWTTVKGGPLSSQDVDGKPCYFSGCPEGHFCHIVGETSNLDEAYAWFKRGGKNEESQ